MSNTPTKFYSSRQEMLIADYLGWTTVAASGARPYDKGDIRSDSWIGECKTHTSIKKRIDIIYSHWMSISAEAMSELKRPILIVDDGSQTIKNTWCVIRCFASDKCCIMSDFKNLRYSKTKLSFNHNELIGFINSQNLEYPICQKVSIDTESLLLLRLMDFKYLLDESIL